MLLRRCGRLSTTASLLVYWPQTAPRGVCLQPRADPLRAACALPLPKSSPIRLAAARSTPPDSSAPSIPPAMGTGSPRARRASTSAAPKAQNNKKRSVGAAPDPGRDDDSSAERDAKPDTAAPAAAAAPPDDDDDAAAPPAKRARKARQSKAQAGAAVSATAEADGGSGGGGEEGILLGDRAAKPKPKAKARGQQPKAEPLPQYTAALRKPPPPAGSQVLNILSWNVAGLRALIKKQPDAISSLVEREGVEVVCLQEHKLQENHTAEMAEALGLKGWSHHWACSSGKLGYSGVSVHSRTPPLAVTVGLGAAAGAAGPDPEHELEGRVVTVELPAAHVVSVYVPNSGEGLKRLDYRVKRWDGAFAEYIRGLEARGKPVIVTGDLNCAYQELDIHAPKTNMRSAGFTLEERESFGRLLLGEVGLVDTFRSLFPGTVAYTYFTRRFNCRAQNKGWRLDYFLTSRALMPSATAGGAAASAAAVAEAPASNAAGAAAAASAAAAAPAATAAAPSTPWRVYDSWILQDVYGSDHLPLGLTLIRAPE